MNSYPVGSLRYFTFSSFENQGVCHAIFTRRGGESPPPWKSLNFGASVGDDIDRVRQNREKALQALGIEPTTVYDVYQIHSTDIVVTESPLFKHEQHKKADAIITNKPNITLLMRFADCVPILLFDPIRKVIGISHAGWIGTINRIGIRTVRKMQDEFGSKPENILAGIGPSIGPDHYVVGEEVIRKVAVSFGKFADQVIINVNGKSYFNLWTANQISLQQAGVENIEIAEICTNCHLQDWYSHRGETGKTGRFGVVIGLSG